MWFVITQLCFVWGSCLIMFICTFVFTLFHWCPKRFPCQMTLGSLNINTTCDSNGAGPADPSGAAEFLMEFVLFNVYFYVVYLLFVVCPFSFGHCIVLPFFDLWLIPLVSLDVSFWNYIHSVLSNSNLFKQGKQGGYTE